MFCSVFQAFSSESLTLGACFLQFLQLPDFLGSLLISPRVCIPSFAKVPWSHRELDTTEWLSTHSLQSHSKCRISEFWITAPGVHTVRLLQGSGYISINRSIQNLVSYVFLLKDTWVTVYCLFVTIQQQRSNSGLNPAYLTHPSPLARRNPRSHFNSAWGSF